ncbi:hypothetical protein RJ639_026538 [Escallonia herrerae]|uniref:BHLH domain-containing protein n=1 Tax=Escallonia herrerae TaxID=1293975 RepID=A0AA89AC76_9ASTE|nr:hypothetical protein RJ639_026538 [Escallonia herrerae]
MSLRMNNHHTNSGLLRFRSAPSYMFADIEKTRDLGPETHGLSSRFGSNGDGNGNLISESFQESEDDDTKGMGNGYALNPQLPPYYPRGGANLAATRVGDVDSRYRVVGSMGVEQPKMGSGLMRQNSSPAGLFSHLGAQNGYATIRGVGSYRVGGGTNGDLSPLPGRLKSQLNLLSGIPSSLGMLSRISELEGESIEATDPDNARLQNGNGDTPYYSSEYPFSSWNDPMHISENFTGLKRELDDDGKLFAADQDVELSSHTPRLSHHLSLPKISAEIAAMEKFLQFQDSVPCKIRAKRGCATHPRSIAERVRRTRISERMRKLQELVPNMDKVGFEFTLSSCEDYIHRASNNLVSFWQQTNTADMLDLAVDYIKDLQKQFKTLSDSRANCKCSGIQKRVPS